MDILHYTVDIAELLRKQQQESDLQDVQAEEFKAEGLENKKELLKYVLPLVHGIYALHNNKCTKTNTTSTGYNGLLGNSKCNIEEKLQWLVDTESDLVWQNNYQSFCLQETNMRHLKIWLNKRNGCFRATPRLPYSMTSVININKDVYGSSIESELEKLAKHCAIYKDNWGE